MRYGIVKHVLAWFSLWFSVVTHNMICHVFSIPKHGQAGCFAFIVSPMFCYSLCSAAFPHGAVGWSAACDHGIS